MIGAVILTMFFYGSPRDYVQTERFSTLAACELYAEQVYKAKKSGTDANLRYHFCFEDF